MNRLSQIEFNVSNNMYAKLCFIAFLLIRKILKIANLRIYEAEFANCEVRYIKVALRISEFANCEGCELRGIPVLYNRKKS